MILKIMDETFFSQLYHQNTKRFANPIPMDSSKWPDEWKTAYYKTYLRLPKVDLSDEIPKFDLFEAIKNRKSRREELSGASISQKELSILLQYSCGKTTQKENGDWRRAQPSGGARYPIEIYGLIIKAGEGLEPGLFHYNVKYHQLEMLKRKQFSKEEIEQIATYEFVNDSAIIIFMTSVFWKSQNKYGDRGYRFILQESGHIGQNIYLISEALGLGCCSLGGFRISDEQIEKNIKIDGVTESLIYTIVVGK
jgi:SagB-type dehydrogenase family enzyme